MYTPEEEQYLLEVYQASENKHGIIDILAESLRKPRRSIIGKLSRLGVYEKKVYLTKQGENPVTKQELVHRLAIKEGIDLDRLTGLEKAPKSVIQALLEC